MNPRNFAISLGLAALTVPAATFAQSQGQSQGSGQSDILGNLLGSIFGNRATTDQTLESDLSQGRRPFAQRRQTLEARIAAGVQNGTISRSEADDLTDEYDEIVDLEARYSANGPMTVDQRRDLRSRYRNLAARVDEDRDPQSAGDPAGSGPVAGSRAEFDTRIDNALRQRRITTAQAQSLRSEYQAILQAEAGYRRNGIDPRERADLEARLERLDRRLGGGLADSGFGSDNNPRRWARLEQRLAAGERSGALPRAEAGQLRTQLADLARLDAAYAAGGLNTDERTYLTRRYAEVEARLGAQRR